MQGALDYLSLVSDASGTVCEDCSNSPSIFSSVLTNLEHDDCILPGPAVQRRRLHS